CARSTNSLWSSAWAPAVGVAGSARPNASRPASTRKPSVPPSLSVSLSSHPRQHGLAGEMPAQILDLQVAHRLARFDGRASDVGKKHGVVQAEEFRRHAWLVGENVQPCSGNLPLLQVTQENRLVDDRAARDVDQVALGS